MNRIEKLLFSKRAPLRRALVKETSREERLKLLGNLAQRSQTAGAIGSGEHAAIRSLVSLERKKGREGFDNCEALIETLAQRSASLMGAAPSPEQTIILTLRSALGYIIAALQEEAELQESAFHSFRSNLVFLSETLGVLSARSWSTHLPVVGIAFSIMDNGRRRRFKEYKLRANELTHALLADRVPSSSDHTARAFSNESDGADRFAQAPSRDIEKGEKKLTHEIFRQDTHTPLKDTARDISGAIKSLGIAFSAIASFFVAYFNAAREIRLTDIGVSWLPPILYLLQPAVYVFDAFAGFTSSILVDFYPGISDIYLPVALWIYVGIFISLSIFTVAYYYSRAEFIDLRRALIDKIETAYSNAVYPSIAKDQEELEIARGLKDSKYVLEAALGPRFTLNPFKPVKTLFSVVWFVVFVVSGPIIAIALFLEILFSGSMAVFRRLGTLPFLGGEHRETGVGLKDWDEPKDPTETFKLPLRKDIRVVFSSVVIVLALLLTVLVSPGVYAVRKDVAAPEAGSFADIEISLKHCAAGYQEFRPKNPYYLRLSDGVGAGKARLSLRVSDLPAQTLTVASADGVLVSKAASTADWGLVKRGSSVPVKPVDTVRAIQLAPGDADAAGDLILEPAYINVKLCVREGVELPPEIASLATEGAN